MYTTVIFMQGFQAHREPRQGMENHSRGALNEVVSGKEVIPRKFFNVTQ